MNRMLKFHGRPQGYAAEIWEVSLNFPLATDTHQQSLLRGAHINASYIINTYMSESSLKFRI